MAVMLRRVHAQIVIAGFLWVCGTVTAPAAGDFAQEETASQANGSETVAEGRSDTSEGDNASNAIDGGAPGTSRVILGGVFFEARSFQGYESTRNDAWSAAATQNLIASLTRFLPVKTGLELRELPGLDAHETSVLAEHLSLAWLVQRQLNALEEQSWRGRRASLQRSVGQGLTFLAERTDAKFLILLSGVQMVPTIVDRAASAALFATELALNLPRTPSDQPVAGTTLTAVVLDMRSGDIVWFGNISAADSTGLRTGDDAREVADCDRLIEKLLEGYPTIDLFVGDAARKLRR